MKKLLLLLSIVGTTTCAAQLHPDSLTTLAHKHALHSLDEFYELLSIPNVAFVPADIERNVAWCERAFASRNFITRRLPTPGAPLLLAERKSRAGTKTVLIYLQLDGQPVKTSEWNQASPWKAVVKERDASGNWHEVPAERLKQKPDPEWRIFARSVADAKGPAMAFLAAWDALRELQAEPDYHIKVIMDFEEELGSPHLAQAVMKYQQLLAADRLIIYDGPRHISNQPTLSFGARGIAEITITTFGPRVPVHSGNYGNFTPNPALRLAQLLASMKDDLGRVIIPGFYDGIQLSETDKQVLAQVPDDENAIKTFLGIAEPDKPGNSFQESLQYPTLNIRGMNALFTGREARTLIPATATAELDVRLVVGSDPERLIQLVKEHIKDQGYYLVDREPTEEERMRYSKIAAMRSNVLYGAFQTPFESEVGLWLNRAMVRAFGKDPVRLRTSGGSIPISPFVITLGIPAVMVPIVNADNNQHAENENLRLGNYMDGVKTYLAILLENL